MLAKLKDLRVILTIVLVLTWIMGGILGFLFHKTNQSNLQAKDLEIDNLQYALNQIGQLVTAYTVASEVKVGKVIEESDLVPIDVPINMASNLVLSPHEIIGKYYKTTITEGTPISYDLVWENRISDDLRLYDLVLDTLPIGLEVGDYVDVRIQLPLGEDYVAISHKRVRDINGGVLKLEVTEKDILTYNSMLIDSFVHPGTVLYAVVYVEAGTQKPSETNYPISKNILAIAQKDPNLLDAIKADMLQRRDSLEEGLAAIFAGTTEDIDRILARGRQQFQSEIQRAHQEYMNKLRQQESGSTSSERGLREVDR